MTGLVKKVNSHLLMRQKIKIVTFSFISPCLFFSMFLRIPLALANMFHTPLSAMGNLIQRETEQDLNHCLLFETLSVSVLKFCTRVTKRNLKPFVRYMGVWGEHLFV